MVQGVSFTSAHVYMIGAYGLSMLKNYVFIRLFNHSDNLCKFYVSTPLSNFLKFNSCLFHFFANVRALILLKQTKGTLP